MAERGHLYERAKRETYAERKERQRQRDEIREIAHGVAEHVAMGDMISVERVIRHGYPGFQFSRPTSGWRCRCGMEMVPFPKFWRSGGRDGCTPIWECVVCNLPEVIALCEKVRERVQPPAPVKARGVAA